MKTFRQLYESPDVIYINGRRVTNYDKKEAWVFAYDHSNPIEGDFYMENKATHDDIGEGYGREGQHLPGRLWKNKKIISFWKYPTAAELKKLIQDIYKASGIKIDDTWNIEIPDAKSLKDKKVLYKIYLENKRGYSNIPGILISISQYKKPNKNWLDVIQMIEEYLGKVEMEDDSDDQVKIGIHI